MKQLVKCRKCTFQWHVLNWVNPGISQLIDMYGCGLTSLIFFRVYLNAFLTAKNFWKAWPFRTTTANSSTSMKRSSFASDESFTHSANRFQTWGPDFEPGLITCSGSGSFSKNSKSSSGRLRSQWRLLHVLLITNRLSSSSSTMRRRAKSRSKVSSKNAL